MNDRSDRKNAVVPEAEKVYLSLRDEIDFIIVLLSGKYSSSMRCRRGCHECCTSITVHRSEFEFIRRQLFLSGYRAKGDRVMQTGRCRFLDRGSCSIYEFRPLICRVHGLPLSYRIESYGADGEKLTSGERVVTACDLNFPDRERPLEIPGEAAIDMEHIEYELERIDRMICDHDGTAHLSSKRVDLDAIAWMFSDDSNRSNVSDQCQF